MSEIMSRGDVVSAVAAQVDAPQKKVDEILKAFESTILRQAATGGEIRMVGFGTFKITHRAARVSRNPRSGDPVDVAARNAIRFIPGQALKDAAASSLETEEKAAPKKAKAAPVAQASETKAKKEKKPAKTKKK